MRRIGLILGIIGLVAGPAWAQAPTRSTSVFSGAPATTGTQLAAANGSRVALVCTNEDTTITIYVGSTDVTTTGGVAVKGGGSITVTHTGIIRARAASGAPIMSCVDEQQ